MPGAVNKRASLPGASELFRPTKHASAQATVASEPTTEAVRPPAAKRGPAETPSATGRMRHDQKITVYFSSEELFALEDATLELKRRHGVALDRGRLVRTAVALALQDLVEHGSKSAVVQELRSQ